MSSPRQIANTDDVLQYLHFIRSKKQEYFICLSLDSNHCLITRRVVTIGLINSTLVHPREVFAGPLKDRATSVIVAHNHPSGIAVPSEEDIKTTQQLASAAQLLGINFDDHLIVTRNDRFSFKSAELL